MKVELTPFQQSQPYTCVAACLRVVLAALGADYAEDDLARACNTDPSGATLSDAASAVRSLGFNAVVVCGIEQGQVIVVDPAIGAERRLELETFLHAWRRRNNRGLVVLR